MNSARRSSPALTRPPYAISSGGMVPQPLPLGELVRSWAKRRADLFVVIGRGGPELRDELRRQGRGGVVMAVSLAHAPHELAREVYEIASAPGFLPRRIVTAMHPDDARDDRAWPLADAAGAGAQRFLVSVNTFANFVRAFAYHTLRNVAWYAESWDFGALKNSAAGRAAVVVGAGPSLGDSLAELRAVQGRSLIVACDTAAPVLLDAGIEPDVITAIDLQPRKRRVLRAVTGRTKAVLAQVQYCHPQISAAWNGPRMWLGAPSPAASLLPNVAAVPETLSVAHAAFFVARHLGAAPIVLAGVDLAFTDRGQTHAAGSFGHWGELGPARQECVAPGLDGRTWPTLRSFQAMATSFEAAIAECEVPVWNATARGLKLCGAERRSLSEVPPGPEKSRLRGSPLAMDVAATRAALIEAADAPSWELVQMCAFATWWRERELAAPALFEAERFARKCAAIAARRLGE